MILANGLYGNTQGRGPTPNKVILPTSGQRKCVDAWATRSLADVPLSELQRAVRVLSGHPDAYSAGYSRARSARERLEAELATRP